MSGGHWEYNGYKLREILSDMGNDSKVRRRFPTLSTVLIALSGTLEKIHEDLDYDISADHMIEDDKKFEQKAVSKLSKILGVAKQQKDIRIRLREIEKELDSFVNAD